MTLQVVAEQFKLNKLDVDLPEETEKSSSSDDEWLVRTILDKLR